MLFVFFVFFVLFYFFCFLFFCFFLSYLSFLPFLWAILCKERYLCTWCHCSPSEAPTRFWTAAISVKVNLDDVAVAGDVGRQGRAAGLLHQRCSVAVLNCHVVVVTCGMGLNVKCCELHCNNQSLFYPYFVCSVKIVWIVVGVVWWRDVTYCNTKNESEKLCFPYHLPSLPQPSAGHSDDICQTPESASELS